MTGSIDSVLGSGAEVGMVAVGSGVVVVGASLWARVLCADSRAGARTRGGRCGGLLSSPKTAPMNPVMRTRAKSTPKHPKCPFFAAALPPPDGARSTGPACTEDGTSLVAGAAATLRGAALGGREDLRGGEPCPGRTYRSGDSALGAAADAHGTGTCAEADPILGRGQPERADLLGAAKVGGHLGTSLEIQRQHRQAAWRGRGCSRASWINPCGRPRRFEWRGSGASPQSFVTS